MKQAKKCNNKALVLSLALSILFTSPVFAAEDKQKDAKVEDNATPIGFEIALGTEMMAGNTTYSIGGPITFFDGSSIQSYFPLSELEWPLDIWLARLSAVVDIGSSWSINGVLKTNISDPGDPMVDQDWLTGLNPGQLDVYSNSDITDFTALILDIDVEWTFLQQKSGNLYTGLGLQYQKFDYDSQLIYQYSPSGQSGWNTSGDGSTTINYEITYIMPYLTLGADYQITPDFVVEGSFVFSPLVYAKDEDNHISRNRVAIGEMNGYAYMLNVSAAYSFLSSWFIEGGFQYTKIDVDGEMDISVYGFHVLSEQEESESTQTSGYLIVGYRF